MRIPRLALAVLCCGLVVATGVAVVASAPPPTQLCGVCESQISVESGTDSSTERETLDIYIDETGDSLWQARVPVDIALLGRRLAIGVD